MINIKSDKEIEVMKEGGEIAARILEKLSQAVMSGISTADLDDLAKKEIAKLGVKASFLGYGGFAKSICTSVNSEVVHGIPKHELILKDDDIVGIDLGIFHRGFHTDTATTVAVGRIDYEKKQLLKVAKEALDESIKLIKPGVFLGDIQNKIQSIVEDAGYAVIRDLAGHGIGRNLQENPSILNFGKKGAGPILKKGMVLAIEPMITNGDWHVKILSDGWTVKTLDNSLSAHFEHTVAVTQDGYLVLTKTN